MLVSVVVDRQVPMALGAVGAFEVAWKISSVISKPFDGEMGMLILLSLLALQGLAIIAAAVWYSSRREDLGEQARCFFRGLLTGQCGSKQEVSSDDTSEDA